MEEQQQSVEAIHAVISERYPMYIANPGFEQWLLRKAGPDERRIGDYLTLLEDYGYITGDGTLANDYQGIPAPEDVTGDISRRLAMLGAQTRDLLRRASVQGERFSLEALEGTGVGNARALVQEAIGAGMVAHDGQGEGGMPALAQPYRFVPAQAAKVLYEELPDDERARYHTELVEFLSAESERAGDQGAQDMLARMISEHNRRFARPDPSPSKE